MSTNKYTQLEAVIYSSEQHACSIIHYIPPGIYVASEEWSCSKGDWPINESSNLATQIIKHDGIFTNMWGEQFKTRSLIWNVLVTLAITKKNNNKKSNQNKIINIYDVK